MIFSCNCAKCGIKESIGVTHYSNGRELCKTCSEKFDYFLLDFFLTNGVESS